ncbi:MAG: prepilin-type N-terminal cleavage/methylation domain-containing protein [Desulfobacterales bacterium]|nr:prepilin-type N-terminal cleavage/methylation domain-containing protein [Desulfobacterales bacterium]
MILTAKRKKVLQVSKLHDERGFTLLEILIAMIILSIGFLGVAALTGGIMRGNSYSSAQTSGAILAQDKMEDIRRQGYSGTSATDATITEVYNSISGYPSYKRETLIDVDNPIAGMKRVTVTVYWDSDAHSIVLHTIIAE